MQPKIPCFSGFAQKAAGIFGNIHSLVHFKLE